ncbi:DNA gyrase subunit A [Streptosporangium vulgare]|uniref:DNA gyrase subunit A n=1 Tax=Streptosporangium vulgare TaxID=46190 RepID=UPI003370290A
MLVVTELPYQVNPDNLALTIAEAVKDGRISGIADVATRAPRASRQRLVIVLKRDRGRQGRAEQPLQAHPAADTPSAPTCSPGRRRAATLRLDQFVRHTWRTRSRSWSAGPRYLLRKAEERSHILRALLKALERMDEVIALIRQSPSASAAQGGLMTLLEIDEIQAQAILDMQLRKLAALERQQITDEHDSLMATDHEYQAILASPERQRTIVQDTSCTRAHRPVRRRAQDRRSSPTRATHVDRGPPRRGGHSRTRSTRGGYAKRTNTDLYGRRSAAARACGARSCARTTSSTTSSSPRRTTGCCSSRTRPRLHASRRTSCPDSGRDARGQHLANLLAMQPDEVVMEVLDLRDYEVAPYLVLATRSGL